MHHDFTAYAARLREFIRRHSPEAAPADRLTPAESDAQFAAFAHELFRLQFHANAPFRALCLLRGLTPDSQGDWRELPALPTEAFKEADISCLSLAERVAVFHSSGTTQQARSRHHHSAESLALYEASLKPWFQQHLLGDLEELIEDEQLRPWEKPAFLALTPPPMVAPHSSLVHMLDVVIREFGASDSLFAGCLDADVTWALDLDRLLFAVRKSMCANRPLVLMGTAFNFVHLMDHFAANNIRYRLAAGSRVMETGGYKGRSREMPKRELHGLITKHLGIPPERIVTEYGMSELSSQAYEARSGEESVRSFRFPPWARTLVISPETGREVAEGGTGLLRIIDLANAWSVLVVQTADLAIRRGDGFELLGRAAAAEARGCSLMAA